MQIVKRVEATIEDVRELQLLEEIYGPRSHINHADFMEALTTRSDWIFNSAMIREKLYQEARHDHSNSQCKQDTQ